MTCGTQGIGATIRRLARNPGLVRTDELGGERFSVHVASLEDFTPRHNGMTYGDGHAYDSRCGYCWLHACHSEAAHAERIERGATSSAAH